MMVLYKVFVYVIKPPASVTYFLLTITSCNIANAKVQHILNIYVEASDQQVNRAKPELMFSKNTRLEAIN